MYWDTPDVTETVINSRIRSTEGPVGGVQLASGTLPDRTHWDTSFTYADGCYTHVASEATSSMCKRTRKCRWMTKRLTRMRAWHGTKGEKQTAGERRRMRHSYEGDFEDRTNGLYFPPGTSEYQSSARVSRRNMRADSHGPPFSWHRRLNRSYRDRNIFITII